MAFHHSPKIVTNGLVLCLDAANRKSYSGTGTVWRDLAGSNNGTLVNGPTFSAVNGGALSFNGSNQYVDCGASGLINISGNFSICVWVYLNATPSNTQVIVERGAYGSADEYGIVLSSISANGVSLQCNNTYFYSNQAFPVNKWVYASFTLSGNSGAYYENGIFIKGGALTAPTTGNSTLNISYRTGGYFFLNGSIAQVSIYNRALTPAEILQNYNATKGRFNL